MINEQILQVAERISSLRQLLEISVEEMAQATDTALVEYEALERGENDFSFTFLYKCARKLGVDISELVTGESPKLSFYTVVKKGEGLPIKRRQGFEYQHLAYLIKNRIAEPFLVKAKYREEEQKQPIHLSTHKGQEFDYILSGVLKVQLEGHTEILRAGDAVYYNSGHGHGMIAVEGQDCEFLAIVISENEE